MKHLLKKKSLFVLFLIVSFLFVFSGCSSLQSDESALVGHWESAKKDQDDGTSYYSFTFNKDGTGVFDFLEVNIIDYSCEDGTLHMDFDNGTTLSYKYRFNDDKSSLYLSDEGSLDEIKFNRAENSQSNDDTSAESNAENSDSENASDNNKEDNSSDTNTDESEQNSTNDEAEYTPIGYDEDVIGYWYTEESDYSLGFNEDGTGFLFIGEEEDYPIDAFCCVDGYIMIDFNDGTTAEIPYRLNKDKTALYLTLADGETKFDKVEVGIG